ncbi:hypothetical protein [Acidisphaera rubrifaciens]|uniref:Uncharacterized protein n=1 Tax=Acidisphaera rubrifaciens HS-AP3 TaxID=1231350 RepID=A0A0D6P3T1_9PROT|nr:hypothetical protein [Acidisphaera rubrifaciens]GAN75848.1 hypothetical protein Asru_0009_41 [Acidisphaera rubrifaciens HS-AP3]
MNVLDRSKALADAAKELNALKKATTLVKAVGSRATQLEEAQANLRLSVGQLQLLRGRNIEVDVDLAPASGFVVFLSEIRTSTAADPASVTAAEVGVKTLTPLKSFTNAIAQANGIAWKRHVHESLPHVGIDLVQVLGQIPALKTRVEHFRALQAAAKAFADRLPTDSADLDAVERAAKACKDAWQALDADDIPAAVTRFLRGATSETGAALDSLTDEVKTWLTAQNLMASFTVRARR